MTDTAATAPRGARILDRRYQRYAGPRKGEAHATYRLSIHLFQRLLGLRRPGKHKIVPILLGIICFALPLIYVAISALLPIAGTLLTYRQVFANLGLPILLFTIGVGPGPLIQDRTSRSLSLYLASPLTRLSYLAAHGAALIAVLLLVTVGPSMLFLVGNMIQGAGPDGVMGVATIAGKNLLASVLISGYYAALIMAAASLFNRPGAAGGILFVVVSVVSGAIGAALFNGGSGYLILADFAGLPEQLVDRLFGLEAGFSQFEFVERINAVPVATVMGAFAGWMALALAAVWYRYRRLEVSR